MPAAVSGDPDAASDDTWTNGHGSRDFDFLHGEWIVANHRMAAPLGESGPWVSFHTTRTCRSLLDGLGCIDEIAGEDASREMSLRLFDVHARRWSIHPASSHDGILRAPLRGSFVGDVGEFIGEDRIGERSLLLRHTWDRSEPARPRWEQAFSLDGGVTWLANWVMHLTRVDWP